MTQAALGAHDGSHGKGCGDAAVTVNPLNGPINGTEPSSNHPIGVVDC
jgi:hypothetical protein